MTSYNTVLSRVTNDTTNTTNMFSTNPSNNTCKFSSLEDALSFYNSNIVEQGRDKDFNDQKDDMNEQLLQLHDALQSYWSQFGFLNNSTGTEFLCMIQKCIMSYPSNDENEEDVSETDDDTHSFNIAS